MGKLKVKQSKSTKHDMTPLYRNTMSAKRAEQSLCITHNHDDLLNIQKTMFEAKYKKLDLNTCITVRRLRLNKRGRCAGKKIKEHSITNRQGSAKKNNLTIIESIHSNIQNRLKAALVNTQSLKPKSNDLVTYLIDTKLDLCILTET